MDNTYDIANEGTRDLLVRGIAAAKTKNIDEARFYLNWVLREDAPETSQVEALFWLSEVSTDPAEQRQYVDSLLAMDPNDARGRRKLAILNGQIKPAEIVDADHLAAPAAVTPEEAEARRFTCPTCGGRMVFSPDGQSLVCENCASKGVQNKAGAGPAAGGEEDFFVAMATAQGHLAPVAMHTVTCQACGVSYLLPPQQLTYVCAYCGSSYVLEKIETSSSIAPSGVIPFKVNEIQAKVVLKGWLSRLFKTLPFVARGVGFYLPAWAFSIGGAITWDGAIEKGNLWLPTQGAEPVQQDNLVILASHRLAEDLRAAAIQYDLTQVVAYDPGYLSNWPAETYQITLSDAALDARQQALQNERQSLQQSFTRPVRNLVVHTAEMTVEYVKLLLLPAWLTYYTLNGQKYQVIVNGQTSAITGEHEHKGLGGLINTLLDRP